MSLKSFDKFCEKIITGEPQSEKDVFDERQNLIRLNLAVESLTIFALMTFVGLIIYEAFTKWCESLVIMMLMFAAAAYLWWTIRAAYKGCLFGVKGSGTVYTAAYMIALGAAYSLMLAFDEDINFTSFENGLPAGIESAAVMGIMIISAIITLAVNRKNKKGSGEDNDDGE